MRIVPISNVKYVIHQAIFIFRFRWLASFKSSFRKIKLKAFGMKIGKGTKIPKLSVTWPNQISIGDNCRLEDGIFFKCDGIWKDEKTIEIFDNVFVGANCEFNITKKIIIREHSLIASGCKFIDHNHYTGQGTMQDSMKNDPCEEISIGSGVWLGFNVIILMGVSVGNSAIVAAGAVVTKSIPDNEIWAGVPAKRIGSREG